MNHVTDCVEKENYEQEKGCTTIIKHYYGCGCNEDGIGGVGENGKSAYELAVDEGFGGTLQEWLESLKGIEGADGVSPTVTVSQQSATEYILNITTAEGSLLTPNLQGQNGKDGIFSPHKWKTDTEIDLGDGSYGIRFIGDITANKGTSIDTVLKENMNMALMISFGGAWDIGSGYRYLIPSVYNENNASTNTRSSLGYSIFRNGLVFETLSKYDRVKSPYDIWFRYTKI